MRTALLCLLGLAVNLLIYGPGTWKLSAQGTTDFRNFYAGARLAGTRGLYDPEQSVEQQRAAGAIPSANVVYNRLPWVALVLWPLGQLPYPVANWIWKMLAVAALVAFVWVWPLSERKYTAIAVCWSLPVTGSLLIGQDAPLLLLWLALAIRWESEGRLWAAAGALALCSEKYSLFIFLPVVLLHARYWGLVKRILVSGSVLLMLSFLGGTFRWPLDYLRFLMNPRNRPSLAAMPNVAGLVAQLGLPDWVALGAMAATAAALWMVTRRIEFSTGLCLAAAAGVVVNVYSLVPDGALLIPALLVLIRSRNYGGALLVGTPLPFVTAFLGDRIIILRIVLILFVAALLHRTWKRKLVT